MPLNEQLTPLTPMDEPIINNPVVDEDDVLEEDGDTVLTPDINENENVVIEEILDTDETIDGDGTNEPLRVGPMEKTGMFAPINEYIDLTESGNELIEDPTKPIGYRVITKTSVDAFGYHYPLSALEKIQQRLTEENSEWRIPTKEDWDNLLNAMECVDSDGDDIGDRSHSGETTGWLGLKAATALKSIDLWDKETTPNSKNSVAGQDIVNFTIYPLGYIGASVDYPLNYEGSGNGENFGEDAGMWAYPTSGVNYFKLFNYDNGAVGQFIATDEAKMAVRLVKDSTTYNIKDAEYILGDLYPTVFINSKLACKDEEYIPYKQVWTSVNLRVFDDELNELGVERHPRWDTFEQRFDTLYMINEWDGEQWIKKAMSDGDKVVIINHINNGVSYNYNEWMLQNGELINITEGVKQLINNVSQNVDELSLNTSASFKEVNEIISNFSGAVADEIVEIHNIIDNTKNVINNDLKNQIKSLTERVESLEASLGRIDKTIKTVVKGYIIGKTHETSVTPVGNDAEERLQISFSEDTIFGENE